MFMIRQHETSKTLLRQCHSCSARLLPKIKFVLIREFFFEHKIPSTNSFIIRLSSIVALFIVILTFIKYVRRLLKLSESRFEVNFIDMNYN